MFLDVRHEPSGKDDPEQSTPPDDERFPINGDVREHRVEEDPPGDGTEYRRPAELFCRIPTDENGEVGEYRATEQQEDLHPRFRRVDPGVLREVGSSVNDT